MIDKETPADVSAAVAAMQPAWELVADLMGGTDAMRAAGKKHLPKAPAESEEAYEARRQSSTLYGAYRHTVETMAGRPFVKPIKLGADVPVLFAGKKDEEGKKTESGYLDNVDLEGRDLQAFAHTVFETALADGIAHILVEFPTVSAEVKTKADEKALGARPYFSHINARNVLGWRAERIAGVMTLTMLRLSEQISEPAGQWGERTVPQVRVLEPTQWTTYRKNDKGDWVEFETGPVTIGCIPLATVYTGRSNFMTACPPLLPLAHLNRKHWQKESDHDNLVHFGSVPILFASGFKDPLVIGAGAGVSNDDPAAKLQYVEIDGASLDAGRESLGDLEKRMAAMGAELLLSDAAAAAQTATKTTADVSQQTSRLAAMVNDFEDSLAAGLGFMARWASLGDKGGTVELEGDYTQADPLDVQSLVAANTAGAISSQTLFEEFRRLGMIDEDLDWKREQERLAADRVTAQQTALDTATAQATAKSGPPGANPAAGGAETSGGGSQPAPGASAAPAPDFGPLIDSIGALVKQLGQPEPPEASEPIDFSGLVDAIKAIPAPVVNVQPETGESQMAAAVMAMCDAMRNAPAPQITVEAPQITVEAPAAPTITMPPVNVTIQKSTGEVSFTEDADGQITGAKLN